MTALHSCIDLCIHNIDLQDQQAVSVEYIVEAEYIEVLLHIALEVVERIVLEVVERIVLEVVERIALEVVQMVLVLK
jgi:hypothetical protein